jgi:hypothetical protein
MSYLYFDMSSSTEKYVQICGGTPEFCCAVVNIASFDSEKFQVRVCFAQGVTKGCRLSWLTNSALVYEPKCRGGGGVAGSQPMSTAVHMEPK